MSTAATFHLLDTVREVLATSKAADPYDLAAEVYKKIPRDRVHLALRQALKVIVLQEISRDRLLHDSGRIGRSSSRKADGLRQLARWERMLAMHRLPTSDGWKTLRDCTRGHLMEAIETRKQQAAANLAKAAWYEKWVAAVDEHGVETVGELPDEVLRDLLDDDEEPDDESGEAA